MASIPLGTRVRLLPVDLALMRFPPPRDAELFVAVHPNALKAPSNQLTQVIGVVGDDLVWAAAIDEAMLEQIPGTKRDLRGDLGKCLVAGNDLWAVVRPGQLLATASPYLTVYHRDRPWVVVGELSNGALLAMPLNDAKGNPKWFAPVVEQMDLLFPGSKRSQLEMAHLWSIPKADSKGVGEVAPASQAALAEAVKRYVS